MTYRIQVRSGARWSTIGLDCLDIEEVRAAIASLAHGVAYRVLRFVGE